MNNQGQNQSSGSQGKRKRGFAAMSREEQRRIASLGGRASRGGRGKRGQSGSQNQGNSR